MAIFDNLGGSAKSCNMFYDPETDIKYLKNQSGEWEFAGFGGLSAVFLFRAPDGLQCSYAISNSRLIVEDTGNSLNIQQNNSGSTGFMAFSKSIADYIGQGKRLYIKAKTTTADSIKINIGSSANYSTSITALNNSNTITVTASDEEYSIDIDTVFTNTNKYLGIGIASGYYGDILCISEMCIK